MAIPLTVKVFLIPNLEERISKTQVLMTRTRHEDRHESTSGVDFELFLCVIVVCGKHCQVESLAVAAHLLNENAWCLVRN